MSHLSLFSRWRNGLRQRRRLAALFGAAALVVAAAVMWFGRSPSPDEAAAAAAAALDRRDVAAVVRLANPDECIRLHISEVAVRGVLDEMLWSRGFANAHIAQRQPSRSADPVIYELRPAAGSDGLSHPVTMLVYNDPRYGWRVSLSQLLYNACWDRASGDPHLRRVYWGVAVRKYGITGVRQVTGDYTLAYRAGAQAPASGRQP